MKKKTIIIVIVSVVVLALLGGVLFFTFRNNSGIKFVDDTEEKVSENSDYKFVGESEHFYFQTGVFKDNDKEMLLYIGGFKTKDNVESDAKFDVVGYIDGSVVYGNTDTDIEPLDLQPKTKEEFEKTKYSMGLDKTTVFYDKSTQTLTKDNVKDSIKIAGKYCKNNKCELEDFTITYVG